MSGQQASLLHLALIFKMSILHSFKKTFPSIWKHKAFFLLVIVFQIFFFYAFFYTLNYYSLKIMDPEIQLHNSYSQLPSSEQEAAFNMIQGKNPLGEEVSNMLETYQSMMTNIKYFLFFSLLIYIVLNGLTWAFTDEIVNIKNVKSFFRYWLKFAIVSAIFLSILLFAVYTILKPMLLTDNINFIPLVIISSIILFFMYLCLALISKYPLKGLFRQIKKLMSNLHYLLLIFIIVFLLIIGLLALLSSLIESNIFLLLIILLLYLLALAWTRVFLITAVNDL